MAIIWTFPPCGGFLAGDTVRGITSYAYPTSEYSVKARRNPEKVASEMLSAEWDYRPEGYDARNMERLGQ
jgi:hypothetical protein